MLERVKAWLSRWGHWNTVSTKPLESTISAVTLHPFVPPGKCARCSFKRNTGADAHTETGLCSIRGFHISEPLTTYCKNFELGDHAPYGAVFTILPAHGNICVPWVDLAVPRESPAVCCICGLTASAGILVALPDGEAGACGPEHYLEWWIDYQRRRLEYFKALGEKAYSDMYDVVFSGATAHYSNAKEAFYSAISTARDLELMNELQALNTRLDHIKNVFRHQFK